MPPQSRLEDDQGYCADGVRYPGQPTTPPMSIDQERIGRFWANCLSKLDKNGVKPEHRRWFVMRAEGFLKAVQPRRLADLGAGDLADDLSRPGRDARSSAWQFRQLVDTHLLGGQLVGSPLRRDLV
jgi:hypothetical protein